MSKKRKRFNQQISAGLMTGSTRAHAPNLAYGHAAEYRIIKRDLFKVLYLNLIYLTALLVLFFTNSRAHYLERWFGKFFHF